MTQEGFKRKLTAILSADVVGYSRLMRDEDEDSHQSAPDDLARDVKSHSKHRGQLWTHRDNLWLNLSAWWMRSLCRGDSTRNSDQECELPEKRRWNFVSA